MNLGALKRVVRPVLAASLLLIVTRATFLCGRLNIRSMPRVPWLSSYYGSGTPQTSTEPRAMYQRYVLTNYHIREEIEVGRMNDSSLSADWVANMRCIFPLGNCHR